MPWLALHLPNLPLQAFQRGSPEAGPLAVAEHGRVLAANAPAQRLGVRAGLGLAAALALAPALALRERAPRAEAAALIELALWAGRYTPQLSLDGEAGLVLEVSASLRLFGGLEALMAEAAAGCRHLGYTAQLAAAPTPLAARWLARAGRAAALTDTAALPAALGPLAIDVIDCAPAITEMLLAVGALTVADCLALPRAGLARRGAAELLQTLDRALGRSPDPRPWFVPPAGFASRLEFAAPVAGGEPLLFAARRLIAALAGHLAARHAGVARFTLRLAHERHADTPLVVTLGEASRDEARLTTLAGEHLARLALPAPAVALALEADHLAPLAGTATSLFPDARRHREQALLLIERLRARLGHEAVQGLAPAADHRPERAWRVCEPGTAVDAGLPAAPRPLWLLAAPEPLASRAGQPCRGVPLTLLAGPERIESGWWDDEPAAEVLRDYYVAAGRDGALLWIYRQRAAPFAWYLHGIFS